MDGRKGGDQVVLLPGYASSSTDRSFRPLRRGLVVSDILGVLRNLERAGMDERQRARLRRIIADMTEGVAGVVGMLFQQA